MGDMPSFDDAQSDFSLRCKKREASVTVGSDRIDMLVTDTAGQEQFRSFTSSYFRDKDGYMGWGLIFLYLYRFQPLSPFFFCQHSGF